MTNERSETDCPADLLEAIPWYPDGLDERQCGALEAHAAACAECRRELAFVRGEPAPEPGPAPDPERVWAQVLARVAAEGGAAGAAPAPRPAPLGAAPRERRAAALGRLSLAASVALALGFGALGLAAGSLLRGAQPPVYRTASAPAAEGAAAGPSLDVVFRSDAKAGEIEAALRAVGGSVVGGPSLRGVFQVALRPGADAAVAAAALGAEADGVASFVGPARP